MTKLTGSKKQIAWAEKIRSEILKTAKNNNELISKINEITEAEFFIDNRGYTHNAESFEAKIEEMNKVKKLALPKLLGHYSLTKWAEKIRVKFFREIEAYTKITKNKDRLSRLNKMTDFLKTETEARFWIFLSESTFLMNPKNIASCEELDNLTPENARKIIINIK